MLQFALKLSDLLEEFGKGNYDTVVEETDSLLGLINFSFTPDRFAIGCHSIKMLALSKQGRFDDVLACLDQTLAVINKSSMKDVAVYTYKTISQIYANKGDSATANHYDYLFLKSKEQLVNKSNLIKVDHLRFMNQLEQLSGQMRLLHEQRRWQNIVIACIAAIAALIIVFAIFLWRKNQLLQEKNRALYHQSVEQLQLIDDKKNQQKYLSSNLNDESKAIIIQRIENVMLQADVITAEDFSITQLAQLVESTTKHVSQIINEYYHHNFNQHLALYRIQEACRRFNNKQEYGNLSIEGIAASVGFKSRSNFSVNFKAVTGMTPGQYRRLAENQNQ